MSPTEMLSRICQSIELVCSVSNNLTYENDRELVEMLHESYILMHNGKRIIERKVAKEIVIYLGIDANCPVHGPRNKVMQESTTNKV